MPGQGICVNKGTLGKPCCHQTCVGPNVTCSSGTCIDRTAEPVLDQSGGPLPGQIGGPCIGADGLCDENEDVALECIDGMCQTPMNDGVLDQSVCILTLQSQHSSGFQPN
jgi:hypothetical protein